MSTAVSPNERQRLEVRVRPAMRPAMFQEWRELLFLHWEYPVAEIQATLPKDLLVDTFAGKAYLGIVPFFMCNVRPPFLPTVRRISNFMELNVRTYVHDAAGVPGVWFYSLDANQPLAVKIARRFFHLPYEHAAMESTRTKSGALRFCSTRAGSAATTVFEYAPGGELSAAAPGSLEFFLIERYRLYANANGRLSRGAVFHEPYPLCAAELTAWDDRLLELDGFVPASRPPDHVIMSPGVEVTAFPLERVVTEPSTS